MIVVTLVLALMASTITPRLFALQRGEDRRKFESELLVLVSDASVRAKQSGQTHIIRFDEAEERFVVEQVSETQSTEPEQPIGRGVALYGEYTVDQLTAGSEGFTAADWQLEFFADGSSSGGGIQFAEGDSSRYLKVDSGTAKPMWGAGTLPDVSEQRWQAGEREVRQ